MRQLGRWMINTLTTLSLLLCVAGSAGAVRWEDYPGDIDMGGWRIARNGQNVSEVVLLGPPGGHVVVGTAAEPMTGFLFSPDYIFVRTRSRGGEQYYVVQRDWPTDSQLGDQRIVKLTGPLTRAELEANATWKDEIADMEFDTPRAPNQSAFRKRPGMVILYSIIALGPMLLMIGVPVVAIVGVIVWLRRRAR